MKNKGKLLTRNWKSSTKKKLMYSLPLYLLMLPSIIYLLIFNYQPIYGIQIAFRDFNFRDGISGSPWVGISHFVYFLKSARCWELIRNTLSINILSLVVFPMPIILALLLNYSVSKKLGKAVQMITYMPHFISVVVLVSMLKIFLSPSIGVVNQFVTMFGGAPVDFLSIPSLFKHIFVSSGVWQTCGWGSIIYIGALTGVSPDLHEAAIIDGANKLQRVWNIDIPSISSTIIIMFIMRIGNLMDLGFQKIYLMQNGPNLEASEVISTYVYQVGMLQSNYSYSTAIGLFNTVINLILLVVANKIAKKVSGTGLF